MRGLIGILLLFCLKLSAQTNFINSYMIAEPTSGDTLGYRSIVFDGVNEYVSMSASLNTVIDLDSTHTINFWFKTTTASADYFFADRQTSNSTYLCFLASTGRVNMISKQGGVVGVNVSTTIDLRDGSWHMVTILNPKTGTTKIYVDGDTATVNSYVTSGVSNRTAGNTFQIAANGAGAGTWVGSFTHFSAWDKVLSNAEVIELYNGGELLNLNTHSAVGNLAMWFRVKDTSSLTTSQGIVDPISAVNGTGVNLESGDLSTDVP